MYPVLQRPLSLSSRPFRERPPRCPITRDHFWSYASRGPLFVGRWWGSRWLHYFPPHPIVTRASVHGRNRAASVPGCYVLRLSCSFKLGHFETRCFPCCAGYLLLRWCLSRGFDWCVGLCLASWWVALRRLAWPCLQLPCPASARRSPPSSRTASGRRRGWCPHVVTVNAPYCFGGVGPGGGSTFFCFRYPCRRPEGSTHCYIALSLYLFPSAGPSEFSSVAGSG